MESSTNAFFALVKGKSFSELQQAFRRASAESVNEPSPVPQPEQPLDVEPEAPAVSDSPALSQAVSSNHELDHEAMNSSGSTEAAEPKTEAAAPKTEAAKIEAAEAEPKTETAKVEAAETEAEPKTEAAKVEAAETEEEAIAFALKRYRAAEAAIRAINSDDFEEDAAYKAVETELAIKHDVKWRDRGPKDSGLTSWRGNRWRETTKRFANRGGKSREHFAAKYGRGSNVTSSSASSAGAFSHVSDNTGYAPQPSAEDIDRTRNPSDPHDRSHDHGHFNFNIPAQYGMEGTPVTRFHQFQSQGVQNVQYWQPTGQAWQNAPQDWQEWSSFQAWS